MSAAPYSPPRATGRILPPNSLSADIRRYFEQALLNNRPRSATLGEHVVAELADDTVLVTGLDITTSVRAGERVSTPGRVTWVLAKRAEHWRIVHFHRSALPN